MHHLFQSSGRALQLFSALGIVRACIDETLRLFTPIPSGARASIHPCVVPVSGTDARGNSGPIYVDGLVRFSAMLIHRRKDLWGEDAEDFVPERWLDPARMKDLSTDPFKFVPFSGGPRICPGQVCGFL